VGNASVVPPPHPGLRAPDVCTRVDDAVAIASLYRTLSRYLYERPHLSEQVTNVDRAIAVENKWRAQRYGTNCIFATRDGPVEIRQMLSALLDDLSADAAALAVQRELEECKKILERGNSADAQLRVYRNSGRNLGEVNRWIAQATVAGQVEPSSWASDQEIV
jgi:glutamate---cysteine ligase / carboxylate-amine ligase